MTGSKRRGAFTLIEILIVVVIMAVLAATIIPQFSSSTTDAKESTAKFNLNTLRAQLQLYKIHHNGVAPPRVNNLDELVNKTDAAGNMGNTVGVHVFGPYLQKVPANPFTGQDTIKDAGATGVPGPSGAADAGWLYREATGEIWLDDARTSQEEYQ